jgi:hypothetical protein
MRFMLCAYRPYNQDDKIAGYGDNLEEAIKAFKAALSDQRYRHLKAHIKKEHMRLYQSKCRRCQDFRRPVYVFK